MEILIRLGELTLKSDRSRRRFLNRLIYNIRDALQSNGVDRFRIRNLWSRIIISIDGLDTIPESLTRVFGIVSLSPISSFRFNNIDNILDRAEEYFREHVKGRRFAVRVRRSGRHEFTSMDIARLLGERLYKYASGVDLKNPDVEACLEVRNDECYLFKEVIKCHGGLPIGTEGKAIALLSGGFDSAVASWFTLRRGAMVHYLFLNLGDDEYLYDVLRVAYILASRWSYGYKPILYAIPGRDILAEIMRTREDYWNIILKRIMYRFAEKMAGEYGADTIITGESLGQVASQTLRNLRISEEAIDIPVNRPLFGLDKEDIINYSRIIGTYNYSARVKEYCAIIPRKPVLRGSIKRALEEEAKMDWDTIWSAYGERKTIDLRMLDKDILHVEGVPIDKACIT